jgi:hypothetical protein
MAGNIYKIFDNSAITSNVEIVTAPLWPNNMGAIITMASSSTQGENQKRYYYDVYDKNSEETGAESIFSVLYADYQNSGSSTGSYGENLEDNPTQTLYYQYRNILLSPEQNLFTFDKGESSEHIYVINVNRSRYKKRIDTGTWQLTIASLNPVTHEIAASPDYFTFIDDSSGPTVTVSEQGGRSYKIVSGSIKDGIYTSDTTPWGLFYPDHGVFVFNGNALDASASFGTPRNPGTSSGDDSAFHFFTSISGAMAADSASHAFIGASNESIMSSYYYCRINYNEFNYTNNPTYVSGSNSELRFPEMASQPVVYFTQVGLYSDNNELLAIANLSKPIKKALDREAVIKIKLDT